MTGRNLFFLACFAMLLRVTAHAQPTGSILYTFQGGSDGVGAGGPGLIQASDGNFYGITQYLYSEVSPVEATIFRLRLDGNHTVLHTINGTTDGAEPHSGLVEGPDGALYGVTYIGGTEDAGTIFRITLGGEFSVLHNFCSLANCADGSYGGPALALGADGLLYSSTLTSGGSDGLATLFSISDTGLYTVKATLPAGTAGTLLQASDGNWYFLSPGSGGNNGGCLIDDNNDYRPCGTLSEMNNGGTISTVVSFVSGGPNLTAGTDAALVEGPNELLYGTTPSGGYQDDGLGNDLCESLNGMYTCSVSDSASSYAGFFLASDGNLYNNDGYFRQVTPSSGFNANIYEIEGVFAEPLQASDGNFYGLGYTNDAPNGVVYKVTNSPLLTSPLELILSSGIINVGSNTTLTFQSLNSFSLTMQQCYLFATLHGTQYALGKVAGTLANNIYSGSTTLTPSLAGTYDLAVTCGGVESGFATLTVSPYMSQSALTATTSPMVGEPLTLRSTITGSHGTPTGTVTFNYGTFALGTAPLSNGTASLSVSTADLPAQTYPLTATYSGSGTYGSSTSTTYDLELAAATTSTTLAVSPAVLTPGIPVKFTATVARSASGATGKPSGNVTFSYAGIPLGTSAIGSNGQASLTFPTSGLEAGNYAITATYSGDAGDAVSTSKAQTVSVQ